MGRLIDRVGERRVLIFYYALVTAMFLGYAFVRAKYVLYAMFVAGQRHVRLRHGPDHLRQPDRAGQRAHADAEHGRGDEPRGRR